MKEMEITDLGFRLVHRAVHLWKLRGFSGEEALHRACQDVQGCDLRERNLLESLKLIEQVISRKVAVLPFSLKRYLRSFVYRSVRNVNRYKGKGGV